MMKTSQITLIAFAGCLGSGCLEDEQVPEESPTFRTFENTPYLNGPGFQGPGFQGSILQGLFNGPGFQGPGFQGSAIQAIHFNGPGFQGPGFQGPGFQGPNIHGTLFTAKVLVGDTEVEVSGMDFIGSEWDIKFTHLDAQGNTIVEDFILRIDNIYPSGEQDDVYLYDLTYRPALGGAWNSLCTDSSNNALPAIPLKNYWNLTTGDRIDDPNVITFACTNGVLAKCTLWGYRPWTTGTRCDYSQKDKPKDCEQVSIADYHQACTRMARADYCGNGKPWTVDGTAIDLWDRLVPPIQQPTTDWFIEAEWNPDGAYCLTDLRHPEIQDQGTYPKCFLKNGKPMKFNDCGTLKKNRALITNTFDKYGVGN